VRPKKKKKKANRVAPAPDGAEDGAEDEQLRKMRAWLDSATPAKPTKKLKPLKPKSAKTGVPAADGGDAGPEQEGVAASAAQAEPADAAGAALEGAGAGGAGDAESAHAEVVQPWWVPPCGTDPVSGAEAEHGISMLTDFEDGRRAAWEARVQNQPRVPPKDAYAAWHGKPGRRAGQPFSLCIPVLSENEPNLADLGVGVCLYFETLRAYGLLFLLLFLLNSPCIIMTFLVNPSAYTDALENGGLFDVFQVGTVAAMLKGTISDSKGCDQDLCVLAPELKLDGAIFGTPAAVPLKYVMLVVSYLDLITAIIFLVFTAWFRRRTRRMDRQIDKYTISLADYSVLVTNLPRRATSLAVRDFLDHYDGTVCPEKSVGKALRHQQRLIRSASQVLLLDHAHTAASTPQGDAQGGHPQAEEHRGAAELPAADAPAAEKMDAPAAEKVKAKKKKAKASGAADAETSPKKTPKRSKPSGAKSDRAGGGGGGGGEGQDSAGVGAALSAPSAEGGATGGGEVVSAANFGMHACAASWRVSAESTASSAATRVAPALSGPSSARTQGRSEGPGASSVRRCARLVGGGEGEGEWSGLEERELADTSAGPSDTEEENEESRQECVGGDGKAVVWVMGCQLGERDPTFDDSLAAVDARSALPGEASLTAVGHAGGDGGALEHAEKKKKKKKKKAADGSAEDSPEKRMETRIQKMTPSDDGLDMPNSSPDMEAPGVPKAAPSPGACGGAAGGRAGYGTAAAVAAAQGDGAGASAPGGAGGGGDGGAGGGRTRGRGQGLQPCI